MIDIPMNTYAEPTEIREDVLAKIIDALLNGQKLQSYSWDNRLRTTYVSNVKNGYGRHTFEDTYYGKPNDCTRMRTCEIKKAFEMLIAHNYFIYRYADRDEISYKLRRSGEIHDKWLGKIVTEFSENIDH